MEEFSKTCPACGYYLNNVLVIVWNGKRELMSDTIDTGKIFKIIR